MRQDDPHELDDDMMRSLYRFGGLLAYTVMRHDNVTHENIEVRQTFNSEHAADMAAHLGGWVVERIVKFDGAFSKRGG